MTSPIRMSVIVCTYNRSRLLEEALERLAQQHYAARDYEIIVVDNNSADDTRDVVETFIQRDDAFRYAFEQKQGVSSARNRGFREARGEYLVYVDDDVLVPPTHLANISSVIERLEPDIIGGPLYPSYASNKPSWFRDDYEIRLHGIESRFSRTCRVNGGNFIVRREVLERIGLFDESISFVGDNRSSMGEDAKALDSYRQQTPEDEQKVYYAMECYVHHQITAVKMTRRYVLSRAFALGRMQSNLQAELHSVSVFSLFRSFTRDTVWNARSLASQIRSHGPFRADYMGVAQGFSRTLGRAIEGFRHATIR